MIKFKEILSEMEIGGREFVGISPKYIGVSKATFMNRLRKALNPITRGFFSDDSWEGVQKVWDFFNKLDLDWNITKSYYGNHEHDTTIPSERKRWFFEINFVDNNDKTKKIYGELIAAGAGSVEEPLSRYDIVVTLN